VNSYHTWQFIACVSKYKPIKDAGAVVKLAKEYDRAQKEMDSLLAEWEGLQG
jgi:hypothetical protein